MKTTLIFLLLIELTTIANAQKQSIDDKNCLIWNCKTLKMGFYKTYEEYIHNSPSIIRKFKVESKSTASMLLVGSGGLEYTLEKGESKVGRFWGLCDGEKVYFGSKKFFWELDFIGKNPSFSGKYGGNPFTLGVSVLKNIIKDIDVFINNEGNVKKASVSNLKELFSSQPELLKEFEAETDPKSKRVEYLLKFNEKFIIQN